MGTVLCKGDAGTSQGQESYGVTGRGTRTLGERLEVGQEEFDTREGQGIWENLRNHPKWAAGVELRVKTHGPSSPQPVGGRGPRLAHHSTTTGGSGGVFCSS